MTPDPAGPEAKPATQGCSFCDKVPDLTNRLVNGPNGVAICLNCVQLCHEIALEHQAEWPPETVMRVLTERVEAALDDALRTGTWFNCIVTVHFGELQRGFQITNRRKHVKS